MTPTNAQIEAVADAIDSALRSNHAMMYEECEAAAADAMAALDIEKIEREAYERGYVDGYEEHRRSVIWAMRQDDTIESIIDRVLAERDIDAMLDAVHPQARLNYLGYADFDLCWNAYLWTPDFVATTGTGPTRTAAIADACRKARGEK